MEIDKQVNKTDQVKEWDNPQAPGNTSDSRDKEQVERQYKEAKRRHDNLSENKEETK